MYESEQREIANAFLDGMQFLFSLMFTQYVGISFLNEENTDIDDIYKEAEHKQYSTPVNVSAKVVLGTDKFEEDVLGRENHLTITIPTKELLDKNVDISPESYNKFLKAKIVYDGVDYFVTRFRPKTLVAETYLFYEIQCTNRENVWQG